MAKETLSERLIKYLRKHAGWVASGELQRLVSAHTTYTPQTTGRVLRQLHEDGVLEVEYLEKNHAWYKFVTTKKYSEIDAIKWFDELPNNPVKQ